MPDVRYGANVNPDYRFIRHRINIKAATDGAYVQRRLTHQRVWWIAETEFFQHSKRSGCFEHRVDTFFRHRAVCRNAAGAGVKPECATMPHERIVGGRLAYDNRASTIQCSGLMDQMKGTFTACFLPCRNHQHQTG